MIGLANFFTLFGVALVIRLLGLEPRDPAADALIQKLKQKGYLWKRKTAYVLYIVTITGLILTTLRYLPSREPANLLMLTLYLAEFTVIMVAMQFGRIKKEDEYLFRELKKMGYSTDTTTPARSKKESDFFWHFSFTFMAVTLITMIIISSTL